MKLEIENKFRQLGFKGDPWKEIDFIEPFYKDMPSEFHSPTELFTDSKPQTNRSSPQSNASVAGRKNRSGAAWKTKSTPKKRTTTQKTKTKSNDKVEDLSLIVTIIKLINSIIQYLINILLFDIAIAICFVFLLDNTETLFIDSTICCLFTNIVLGLFGGITFSNSGYVSFINLELIVFPCPGSPKFES